MFQININSNKNDIFEQMQNEIQLTNKNIVSVINQIGTQTAIMMISIIKANKVRPQDGETTELENNIDTIFFKEGWGVGDIEKLNQEAPYWAAVNYGSNHMVGRRVPLGAFSPQAIQEHRKDNLDAKPNPSLSRSNRWFKGNGSWTFIVKNPIPPMNYIEKTIFWLIAQLDNLSNNIEK